MIEEIRNFGKQFGMALEVAQQTDLLEWEKVENLYLCGMGGSSSPGDIINTLLRDQVEIKFIRDYDIPVKEDYSKDFYVLASFSGNTEEVLSCLKQVEEANAQFAIMAHGGILQQIAQEKGYAFLQVPACKQPRLAAGYFVTFWFVLLSQLGKVDLTWFDALMHLETFLDLEIETLEAQGKQLAQQLKVCVPVVYADRALDAIARITKINFNENSKTQAFWNSFPELNHNEMVGYTNLVMQPIALLLKSSFMHPRNRQRMEVMEKVLGDKMSFVSLEAKGETHLQQVFWVYLLGAFASYYLALEYGVDPMPVEMVEEFKEKLKKVS